MLGKFFDVSNSDQSAFVAQIETSEGENEGKHKQSVENTSLRVYPDTQAHWGDDEAKEYTLEQLALNPTIATGSKPISIRFGNGNPFKIIKWTGVAICLVEWLNKVHGFQQVPFKATENGANYFINNAPYHSGAKKMTQPVIVEISNKTAYIETCQNTTEKLRIFMSLVETSGANPTSVFVELI